MPAITDSTADFIRRISASGKSSASIRRVVAIPAILLLNRLSEPTKDPEVRIAIERMHSMVGRTTNQAYDIR